MSISTGAMMASENRDDSQLAREKSMQIDSIRMNRRTFLQGIAAIASAASLPLAPLKAAYNVDAPLFATMDAIPAATYAPTVSTLWLDDTPFSLLSAGIEYVFNDYHRFGYPDIFDIKSEPRSRYCNLSFESKTDIGQSAFQQPKSVKLFLPSIGTYYLEGAWLESFSLTMHPTGELLCDGRIVFSSLEVAS